MTESNIERNARQPSVTKTSFTRTIRALLKQCNWPEGGRLEATAISACIRLPNGDFIGFDTSADASETDRARCEFIAAACNHFLLEQELEREFVKTMNSR